MAVDWHFNSYFIPNSSYQDMGSSIVKLGDFYICGCPRITSGTAMGEVFRFSKIGAFMKPTGEYNHNYMATSTYGHGTKMAAAVWDETAATGYGYHLFISSPRYRVTVQGGVIVFNYSTMRYDTKFDFYYGVSTAYSGDTTQSSFLFPHDISAWKRGHRDIILIGTNRNSYVKVWESHPTSPSLYTEKDQFTISADNTGNTDVGRLCRIFEDDIFVASGWQYVDTTTSNEVHVHYYDSTADDWETISSERLYPSDATDDIRFGSDIEYDAVTNYLFISAHDQGVYMFEKSGGSWTEVQKLDPPGDSTSGDNWGENIYVYDNKLFVAAPNHGYDESSANFISEAGAVYYYDYDSTSFTFNRKFTAQDKRGVNDHFGRADMLFDGEALLIGCYNGHTGNGSVFWWSYEDYDLLDDTETIISID